jgi:hypothetical protein
MKQPNKNEHPTITAEEVNRILEVGRLLLSVLTKDEIEQLNSLLTENRIPFVQLAEIGNTGDS